MGRIRERAALTGGAILLGLSVAALIARRPFLRLAGSIRRRGGGRGTAGPESEREPQRPGSDPPPAPGRRA